MKTTRQTEERLRDYLKSPDTALQGALYLIARDNFLSPQVYAGLWAGLLGKQRVNDDDPDAYMSGRVIRKEWLGK